METTAERARTEIPIQDIDLSQAQDTEDEARMVISKLRGLRVYKKGLLFSGFNGEEIDKVKNEGRYSQVDDEYMYCSKEAELKDPAITSLKYAAEQPLHAMAVYKGEALNEADLPQAYKFKPGVNPQDALVAIVKLRYQGEKPW